MNQPLSPPPPPSGQPPGGQPPSQPPSPPPPGGPPSGSARAGLPWEQAKDLNGLLETIKLMITAPGEAYSRAREKGDYLSPLLFAIILGILGTILASFWQIVFGGGGLPPGALEGLGDVPPEMRGFLESMAEGPGVGGIVIGVLLVPIWYPIVLFILSGLIHLGLSLFGGTRESTAGFEGTFRVVGYATIAQLAQIIPVVGGLIAFVWAIVLYVLGLSSLHRCSQGQALAGALTPIILCCLCCVLFVIAMVTMGVGAGALGGLAN